MLHFDIETNGLLHELTEFHCGWVYDDVHDVWEEYRDVEALATRLHGEHVCGHNILQFDVPAIRKFCPWFSPAKCTDTLYYSRLIWVDILANDMKFRARGRTLPGKLMGTHKLEAWGYRLGVLKDDYAERMKERGLDPWAEWNQEMHDYCRKDVEVTYRLWCLIKGKDVSEDAIELEHQVGAIISRQEVFGFPFNVEKALKLELKLRQRKLELEEKLTSTFGPFYVRKEGKDFYPKRDNKTVGYVAGAPCCKVKLVDFNPGSRVHIANRLINLRGWEPTEFTKEGPKVDDEILKSLPWPEAQLCAEYLMVAKRLGQLADGADAVLRHLKDGRVHGSVNTLGTVTGRMSHSKPNVAQTPASYSPYGPEFRELYEPPAGYVLVGCDADGLEQRGLGHFMAPFDKGKYIEAVLSGDKKKGTDAHSMNMRAIGLNSRDNAKTWFYAFIYGAGDAKLGAIVVEDMTPEQRKAFGTPTEEKLRKLGAKSRRNIEKGLPALGKLVKKVKKKAKENGRILKGLDGRKLHIRGLHSALNTVIQSSGAVLMKRALVIADADAQARGWKPGVDYEFVANVHDEFQAVAKPEIAEELGQIFAQSITKAGDYYGFRCRLDGSADIGSSWKDTH